MNWVIIIFLVSGLLLMELAIGGTRLVFSLPAYALIALAGMGSGWIRKSGADFSKLCVWGVLGVGLGLMVRAWFSPVEYLALSDLYSLAGGLLAYFLAVFYAGRGKARSTVVCGLLLLAVLEVFIGMRQFSGGDNWMPFGLIRADMGRRASGTFISPNHLAGYLELVGLLALSWACWSRSKAVWRWGAAYVFALCVLGVAVTGSRGGYLSLMVGLGVFVSLSLWAVRRIWPGRFRFYAALCGVGLVALCAGGILLMQQNDLLRYRLRLLASQTERENLDVRVHNWAAALEQAKLAPWFGTGAGTHLYYGRYFRRVPLQHDPVHAHGDYLEFLAEYGLVGLGGLIGVVLVHLHVGFAGVRRVTCELRGGGHGGSSDTLAVSIAGLTASAAIGAHSVVDFNLHIPGNALLMCVLFGWVAAANGGRRFSGTTLPQVATPASRVICLVPVILGIGVACLALPKFPGEYQCERARMALRDRDFSKAVIWAQKAELSGSKNPDLYFHLGEALRGIASGGRIMAVRTDFFAKAVEAFRQSLVFFPQNEHVWVRMGQALDGMGRHEEAEAAFLEAIRLDPRLGVLYIQYSAHLATVGRSARAEEMRHLGERLRARDVSLEGWAGLDSE